MFLLWVLNWLGTFWNSTRLISISHEPQVGKKVSQGWVLSVNYWRIPRSGSTSHRWAVIQWHGYRERYTIPPCRDGKYGQSFLTGGGHNPTRRSRHPLAGGLRKGTFLSAPTLIPRTATSSPRCRVGRFLQVGSHLPSGIKCMSARYAAGFETFQSCYSLMERACRRQ